MNLNDRLKRVSVMAIVCLVLGGTTANAQEATSGTVTGNVIDAQGLAIPGATVTITSAQGARTFITDAEGRFHAAFLTPGVHAIRLELEGYRPWSSSVTVEAGARVRVGGSLEP